MKKIILVLLVGCLVACNHVNNSNSVSPLHLNSSTGNFVLAPGDMNSYWEPKVTLQIPDSTFSPQVNFSFLLMDGGSNSLLTNKSFEGYYWTFFPHNQPFVNAAFITYDYHNSANLTSVKPYKVLLENNSGKTDLNDTSKWVLIPNFQFSVTNKMYTFPVNDFQHVYFMAKKP
ncbi:MAG: hypothetical protein IAF38_07365 [Bacteroidia bacterium]|nr:hypothetical protein [Bacteroidia bacterium]